MAVRIGQTPESDFTNPLGLLSDCHRRIERFLAALIEITGRARGAELSEEDRKAFEAALRYFREAAPKHTLDEEESLFPRLRALGGPRAASALAQLDRLHEDHLAAEARHREADALGRLWLARRRLPGEDAARMARLLEELRVTYQTHIRAEDEEVFPLAAEVLPPAEVEAVGQEMAARRGVGYRPAAV